MLISTARKFPRPALKPKSHSIYAMRLVHSIRPAGIGFTLLETIVVLVIMALMLVIVVGNVFGYIQQLRLDEDVRRFARTLRLSAEEAMMRSRDVAVVIEVLDGYYTVYEAKENDIYREIDTPLVERQGLDICWIDKINHEDGTNQYSGELILRATPSGWNRSVVFDLIDKEGRRRYLRCDRLTTKVTESKQPLELLEPREQVSMTAPI